MLITDEAYKNIIIQTKSVDLSRVQISLHPTIDKQLFISQGIIKLKDAKRSFPLSMLYGSEIYSLDNSISLLRWKVPNPDESYLPLNITCWPEPSDSSCTVNLEYEANLDMIPSLNNVNISIPLPHGSSAPTVNECDGQYTFYSKDSIFDWNPATIDENNKYVFPLFSSIIRREGHLEFVCSNSTEEEFFPVTATFNSKSTYSTLEVCFDRSLLLLAVSRLRTSTFLIVMLLYPSSRVYPSLSTLILLSKHLVYNRVSCSSSLLLSDCFAFSCFFPFS